MDDPIQLSWGQDGTKVYCPQVSDLEATNIRLAEIATQYCQVSL